jgi:DNA polymerase III subunit delta'
MHFGGFYGNEQTTALLSGIFSSGRIPHAILIDGPQGAGKKTLAGIIAAAAVCEAVFPGDEADAFPCGRCRQCINAFGGTHPDIMLYTGSGTRSFGVDLVRKIRLDAYVSPNDARRKVYILADIEDMTEQAQNALLKILEEPPQSVLFILTCDARAHLLETVRSRTQPLAVGPVPVETAARAIKEQCPDIDGQEALRAARISGGIVGRAKMMLDAGFSEVSDFAATFTKRLCGANHYEFLALSGKLEKDGGLFTAFLDLLPALMRDAIAVRGGGAASLSGFYDEASALSRGFSVKKLYRAQLTALESQRSAERNANLTLHLTTLFATLWRDMHC